MTLPFIDPEIEIHFCDQAWSPDHDIFELTCPECSFVVLVHVGDPWEWFDDSPKMVVIDPGQPNARHRAK